jgi:DNA transformation protein
MVASAAFAEFLKEQLAPLGPVTLRLMFGKTGVSREGVMLGTPSISAWTTATEKPSRRPGPLRR